MKIHHLFLSVLCVVIFPVFSWAAPTLEDFTTPAELHDAELSPNGRYLAVILNEKNTRAVYIKDLEAEGQPIIGSMKEDLIRPSFLYWGNDNRLLISMLVPYDIRKAKRERERDSHDINDYFMLSRMIAVNKDFSNMVLLMEGERGLRRNISLSRVTNFLPNETDHVLMAAYKSSRRTLYRVNIMTGESELVTRGSRRTYKFLSDNDGVPKYRFDYLRVSNSIQIFQYNSEEDWNKVDRIFLDQDDEDQLNTANLVVLSADSLVYRLQNEETGYYELVKVDRKTNEKTVFASQKNQDIRNALISNRSDQIIGYSVEKDFVRARYFDEERQKQYDAMAKAVGSYNFRVDTLNAEHKRALVTRYGVDDPRSYFLWDFDSQKLIFINHAFQGLATNNLSLPGMATYKTRDGTRIRAYMTLPENFTKGERYPTIVLPHGGPHARSRPQYTHFTQFLSTRGYIVIEPNFRGSVGYGRDFEQAGYKQWGGLMQDDVTDAINFLVKKGYSDPNKVCIVGFSYGGYAALMGAIKTPDLYRCAISLNGVTHMVAQIKYDMKKLVDKDDWEELIFKRRGHPKKDKAMLDQNSPALHAEKIKIPVMIIAGMDDERVPVSQAKKMVKALKKAGVEYEFIRLKDTGHNPVYTTENIEVVFPAVEKFIEQAFK